MSLAEIREADGIVPAIADELGMRLLGNVDPDGSSWTGCVTARSSSSSTMRSI